MERDHQNFRRALLMKMSPFPLSGISSFLALSVLHVGLPLRVIGLEENGRAGRDGNKSALLEQQLEMGTALHGSLCHIFFRGRAGSFIALPVAFPSRKDHFCALSVALPVRGS